MAGTAAVGEGAARRVQEAVAVADADRAQRRARQGHHLELAEAVPINDLRSCHWILTKWPAGGLADTLLGMMRLHSLYLDLSDISNGAAGCPYRSRTEECSGVGIARSGLARPCDFKWNHEATASLIRNT